MTVYRTINPTTGQLEKSYDLHGQAEVAQRLQVAHTTWLDDWKLRSFEQRADILNRAADILRRDKERFARLISVEMGKVFAEALWEVGISADILAYYAKEAARILAPRRLDRSENEAFVLCQPLGVIYCIEPWNFPYYQLARVVGPNLMAGNVVMVKHAPGVPQCAEAFEQLFHEAGAPRGTYTNLFITNDQSADLIAQPEVRGVALTGSERAGKAVAGQAGSAIKKSTMELGGSDAFIVLDDADLDKVVPLAVAGRMTNNGQVCAAPKRMIVHHTLVEEFTERFAQALGAFRYGDPLDGEVTHGPMSSEDALNRTLSQVETAVAHGATLLTGGQRIDRPGFYMKAGILTGVTKDNPIFYEEVFGPIAIIYPVSGEDEAIRLANDSPYGLGGSVHTRDIERGRSVAERIETGMVYINGVTKSYPDVPFGGVGNSGYGRELADFGLHEFVNHKLVYIS
ncbi:aldehyde dehydrogenase [Neoasaia chiangmaiensis NBRC 101099]|uniref:Succinate-semialdehyde dehydrogenase n=1 Tax=Neoasaia chiangmaiensis TaxID=320497 RepID=A0A1U9KTT3_9PROT|nr:NAD-dependent succinate-semialdehyde dehydrogenase [Neoasaia chiangmaiensis]AQS89127.1 succinate-semialdehyde dehydrogenase [Neoasaia chiangmaiensis]GBR37080.1 aldehyde dehydrogenase [Neoasaia chiangmaiensis NBRC 101099]GEN16524.1 aldehyde dehydrogenase [Neoasaia chiangmaiensis]